MNHFGLKLRRGAMAWILTVLMPWPSAAQEPEHTKLKNLENQIEVLMEELVSLKESSLTNRPASESHLPQTTVGGYGEIHFNNTIGTDESYWDIHRFVLYVGHRFSDRVSFHSETELEHAWLEGGDGGEVAIEQMFVDISIRDDLGFRFGRVLIPVGRINPYHEPTLFYGVERPGIDKYVIPTTWSGDGAGMYGGFGEHWRYELYLTSGLNGSGFNATDGIRGGRQKERPGFNDPSLSGRLSHTSLGETPSGLPTRLNLAASFFTGGVNNGNKGGIPGTDTSLAMWALNVDAVIGKAEFHGQFVTVSIADPTAIGNGLAKRLDGWYLETAWHLIRHPTDAGSLIHDLVLFVRFEDYNTQAGMPPGIQPDPRGSRNELTAGISWYPAPDIVLKADYQVLDDATQAGRHNRFNMGVGWRF